MADMKLKGGDELQKFLQQLAPKIERNIMRAALRAGAKVVQEEAKRNVPVKLGKLRDSLKVSTNVRGGKVTGRVRTKMFYARFVEFGAAAHDIKPKAAKSLFLAGIFREIAHHPGARPKPFLRPALDASAGRALQAVGEVIKRRLTKAGIETGDAGLEVEE